MISSQKVIYKVLSSFPKAAFDFAYFIVILKENSTIILIPIHWQLNKNTMIPKIVENSIK